MMNSIDTQRITIIGNPKLVDEKDEKKGYTADHFDIDVILPYNPDQVKKYKYAQLLVESFGFLYRNNEIVDLKTNSVIMIADIIQINSFDNIVNNSSKILHMSMLTPYTEYPAHLYTGVAPTPYMPATTLINDTRHTSSSDVIYVPVNSIFQKMTFSIRDHAMEKFIVNDVYWHAVISFKFFE